MNHYKIYGMHFTSDFAFIQLETLSGKEAEEPVIFTVSEGIIPKEYKLEKSCYSRIGKPVSYLANHTCYLLVENGNRIVYERKPRAEDNNLNAYLLGWGLAMLCFQQGKASIHCSCVADKDGAILISGRSGSGKSTITTAFLKAGYTLVTDDMAVITHDDTGKICALPAYPYQKLCRDAAEKDGMDLKGLIYIDEKKDKFLIPYKGTLPTEPLPIRAMLILDWKDETGVRINSIEGVNKLYACMDTLFLKVLFKENLYCAENVTACLQLASAVPIYAVSRKKRCDTAGDVVKKLTKAL